MGMEAGGDFLSAWVVELEARAGQTVKVEDRPALQVTVLGIAQAVPID